MAKVTEQDIITFLQEKVSTLQIELNKAQSALESFSGSAPKANAKPASDTSVEKVKSVRGKKVPALKPSKPLAVPEQFNADDKMDKKLAYILSTLGASFNSEVVSKIQELEPEKDADKLGKAVIVKLASLFKAGRIKGTKLNGKYKYEL
ncbi:hypothetical protein ADIARSV_1917 [Arcticibacter svalbardensis MN12-7]|uniref:Uncharacterized protein n=1 Tax=Arcticibacter svalbardensis MN12-7 TaxID=1150600 RepID=R9GTB3_9SPHI|nr:hypothetical protein [Arcticibacter svalbardensis]EOR94956.1 hypothetical protein ADIARSV_1917 [Arcticibacter svalbardensis MN12-7]